MAVVLEFIHLFIPMRLIDEQFPGGWPTWKSHYRNVIGRSAWFDEHLYSQGAMNGLDIDDAAAKWKHAFPALFSGEEGFAMGLRLEHSLLDSSGLERMRQRFADDEDEAATRVERRAPTATTRR